MSTHAEHLISGLVDDCAGCDAVVAEHERDAELAFDRRYPGVL